MYSYTELAQTTREFQDLAGDLMKSNTDTFQSSLNFFRSFCEKNEIIQQILSPIKENQFDTPTWFNEATKERSSMVGSADGTLPKNQLDALTAIYDLLWDDRAGHLLLSYGHSTMFSRNLDEQLKKVNNHLTIRLIRYIMRRLEEMIEPLKFNQSNSIIHNYHINAPTNLATQSSGFTQNLTINNPDIKDILVELRAAIQNADLPDEEKESANETVDMIEEELAKEEPRPSRVTKLLNLLPPADSLLGITEKITNMVSI